MNTIPDWARKYKTKGVYIRNVGNSYYAYRTRSKWDKENKKQKHFHRNIWLLLQGTV